jgi:hypothetical protein
MALEATEDSDVLVTGSVADGNTCSETAGHAALIQGDQISCNDGGLWCWVGKHSYAGARTLSDSALPERSGLQGAEHCCSTASLETAPSTPEVGEAGMQGGGGRWCR